jgi:hypothetical protein
MIHAYWETITFPFVELVGTYDVGQGKINLVQGHLSQYSSS